MKTAERSRPDNPLPRILRRGRPGAESRRRRRGQFLEDLAAGASERSGRCTSTRRAWPAEAPPLFPEPIAGRAPGVAGWASDIPQSARRWERSSFPDARRRCHLRKIKSSGSRAERGGSEMARSLRLQTERAADDFPGKASGEKRGRGRGAKDRRERAAGQADDGQARPVARCSATQVKPGRTGQHGHEPLPVEIECQQWMSGSATFASRFQVR